ncbi:MULTISPECIES: SDR family NAD(P)-dependent oxidoreductase [Maribacter]|uniref:SDR family NAD(P)-dependent oxidoreductase n=1 Tax=Maribacter flavus TaxID=1658664 RepID=A0ABU7IIL7_9FLAO|nr:MULTISPECIES: SDR family NAD(P)-dependent oxidoreductase [Maribacter]MDC6405429.1 SDR family NAD(P)-dependent oxidoreductase [Maribacter sp. PR66]MEE1972803.1 SDR family NAD(P)-dependent oxidoreductase [Maribacter flavus]
MKTILLIGGSHGIGLDVVDQLKETHNLLVASRTELPESHKNINHIQFDATEDVLNMDDIPNLDGFVYCPGSINLKPFKMMSLETFENDMEINFFGLIRVVKDIIPKMKDDSSMVFFSTVAVSNGMPFHTSVAAAKGAIEGFAKSLAAEYAPKVRVNVVAPSLIDTPLASRLLNNDKKRESMGERHPLKRVGKPEDIGNIVSFLLSDKSSWMTGQVIGVDGGISTLNLS